MSTTIVQRIEFDAGHRVLGHGGKCKHLHGHRYVAEVEIASDALDELGMVIDFSEVKCLVKNWIDANWDHNLLLNPDDPQRLHLDATEERRPYIMPHGNPTAENLAAVLWEECRKIFPRLTIASVTIWETPNCRAEYRP